jgi:hypothetical protein
MSICRTTILETHTKEDADSLLADYIENFDSMFPECTLTLNSRIDPTTLVSNSVYPDQEAIEKTGNGARKEFTDKHKNRIKQITTHVGEVTLSK